MKTIVFLLLLFSCAVPAARAQEIFFQSGHKNDILRLRFSPDDSQLVSYSAEDGDVILWNVADGRVIWKRDTAFIRRAKERASLETFDWSADGKRLITNAANGRVVVWNLADGEIVGLYESPPSIELARPATKTLSYSRDYSNLGVNDYATGKVLTFSRYGNNSAITTSNNGELIAEGGGWNDAAIRITDAKNGRQWFLDAHPANVEGLAFTPDGRRFVVAGTDRFVYVFETATRRLLSKFSTGVEPASSMALSPDGKTVVINFSRKARVFELETGRQLSVDLDLGWQAEVSFSPRGDLLLAYGSSFGDGEVKVFSTSDWKPKNGFVTDENYESKSVDTTIGYDSVPATALTFLSDGTKLITAHKDSTLRVWNASTGKQLKKIELKAPAKFIGAVSKDEILALVSEDDDDNLIIVNIVTGKKTGQLSGDVTFSQGFAVSADGLRVAVSDIGGDILFWDRRKGQKSLAEFDTGFSGDDKLVFSPDGKLLLTGGRNQNLFLFDVEKLEKIWQLNPDYVQTKIESELAAKSQAGWQAAEAKLKLRETAAAEEVPRLLKQIKVEFLHFGTDEDAMNLRTMENGEPKQSKTRLERKDAKVAWFKLTNGSPLAVSTDSQSMIFNPRCKGVCNGDEVPLRYLIEAKTGEISTRGIDMFASVGIDAGSSIVFSVLLEDFDNSKAIYAPIVFIKPNPDNESQPEYGTPQRVNIQLPKD